MGTKRSKKILLALLLLVVSLSLGAAKMARGPGPSWNRIEKSARVGFTNLEELAARQSLGMGALEGGGRTIWATSFKDGLAEVQTFGTVEVDSVLSFQGANSAKLTTGALIGDHALIQKQFLPLENERVGIEIMYSNAQLNQDMQLRITDVRAAADVEIAMVRIYVNVDGTIKKLQYASGSEAAPVWNDIADVGIPIRNVIFNHFKLVVDPATRKIVRIIFNGSIYDGLDYDFATATTTVYPYTDFQARCTTLSAMAVVANIDNMIITGGER